MYALVCIMLTRHTQGIDEGGKWKGESLISDVQILLLILFNFFFHQSHSQ